MASLTPTSDPVTPASPTTPPVSDDPIVASDRPDKPIMGNIVSHSRDEWPAWTGGKSAPGWVGLDPSAADDITLPNQLRPAMPPPHKRGENERQQLVPCRLAPAHQDNPVDLDRAFRGGDLKAAIKACHPLQYAGENLEARAADYRKDARELMTAGQYNHNLTLMMLTTFLVARGAGNEDFRFPLRSTKQKLDQALLDIGYKEK
ncbi:hypothetical protein MHU86_14405 [Fragilaria crotonensis]|nr:hypothetical protein MHU86_14405 [Fragilaria crotonensis]